MSTYKVILYESEKKLLIELLVMHIRACPADQALAVSKLLADLHKAEPQHDSR